MCGFLNDFRTIIVSIDLMRACSVWKIDHLRLSTSAQNTISIIWGSFVGRCVRFSENGTRSISIMWTSVSSHSSMNQVNKGDALSTSYLWGWVSIVRAQTMVWRGAIDLDNICLITKYAGRLTDAIAHNSRHSTASGSVAFKQTYRYISSESVHLNLSSIMVN